MCGEERCKEKEVWLCAEREVVVHYPKHSTSLYYTVPVCTTHLVLYSDHMYYSIVLVPRHAGWTTEACGHTQR